MNINVISIKLKVMTNEELKSGLKTLLFEEYRVDKLTAQESFNLGNYNNQEIFDNIKQLIEYYRNECNK